jgi:hypothetical protein
MARKDIIQELNELGSSLAAISSQNIYSVPGGYFETFASSVLSKINAENNGPFLAGLPKSNPYKVPVGYFDELAENMLHVVRNHPDYLNSQEELESISPLLNSLKKEPVFSVPNNYFENFTVALNHKPAESSRQSAKVVPMFSRKFMRYAAAAITVLIGSAVLLIYMNRKTGVDKIMARVEKDVKKIDDVKQLDNLADFMDAGLSEKEVASTTKIKTDDVEKLLKDVSIDELNEFSDESKDIQDVMMTN